MAVTITRAQYLALRTLSDGQWHQGKRVSEPGTVLSTVGSALWRAGLTERRGASRIIPKNPGFEYRITEEGEAAIDAYVGTLRPCSSPSSTPPPASLTPTLPSQRER